MANDNANGNGRRSRVSSPRRPTVDEAGPRGSALYEVLKGIDFERRQLVGKPKGAGLLSLVEELGQRVLLMAPGQPGLLYDGPPSGLLKNDELLIKSGLAHRHHHIHDGTEHAHFHVHDAD